MKHRSPAPTRPTVPTAPPRDAVQFDQSDTVAREGGGFTAAMERFAQKHEILAVTYWFDAAPRPEPYPVTIRFSGHRIGLQGQAQPGDRFVHDQTIEQVVPGSGPISLTTRVQGITPGDWVVTAQLLDSAHPSHSRWARRQRAKRDQVSETPVAGPLHPIVRFWRWWAPSASASAGSAGSVGSVGPAKPVSTGLAPFARVPGIIPGIWGVMVALGLVSAVVLQAVVSSHDHLALGPVWAVWLPTIVVGSLGAKGWFIVLHRRERRWEGWCIQGFIAGATLAAAIMLVILDLPAGIFLDAAAPGLLVGMAVGRVGCFFAGCCGGPPTASHWGVWSSDQDMGARRIPTQLLELVLALSLGLVVLVAVLAHGPAGGAFFVAGLAAYTLGRQGILHLRAERRKTKWGGLVIAALAALVLIAAIAAIVFLGR